MGSVVPPLLTAGAVRLVPDGCTGEGTWRPSNAGKTERVTARFSPGRLKSELQLISSECAFQRSFDPAHFSGGACQLTLLCHSLFVYCHDNIPKGGNMSRVGRGVGWVHSVNYYKRKCGQNRPHSTSYFYYKGHLSSRRIVIILSLLSCITN